MGPVNSMEQPIALFAGPSIAGLAKAQCACLEAMFGDPRLERLRSRHPGHPAVVQYERLMGLEKNRVQWPDEFEPVAALASVGLDFSVWTPDPPFDDFWDFLDEETRRWTVGIMENPDQYGDAMAELFVWGWIREQGIPAVRVNAEGRSDILVGADRDWSCEVKRIRKGTKPEHIRKVLAKANRQIKATAVDGGGSVFIMVERAPRRVALDDRVPNDVQRLVEATRRALHAGQLRSIAQVVVAWDDVMMAGEAPEPMLYAFRRRSLIIEHPAPRQPARYPAKQMEIGRTMITMIRYEDRDKPEASPSLAAIPAGDISVSPLFRQENEFADGIRANHAVETLAEPDSLVRLAYDDWHILLATRGIDFADGPYTLLVVGIQEGAGPIQAVGGYRLYRQQNELDLSRDALAAFRVLLDRYGLEISTPTQAGRFIPFGVLPPGVGLRIPDDNDSHIVSAVMKLRDDGSTEIAGAYGLDTGRYRAALRRKAS